MTLDEAIQKCIKDAQRITKGFYDEDGNWCHDPEIGDKCIQVAEWLKELKHYREIKNSWNRIFPNGEEVNADD